MNFFEMLVLNHRLHLEDGKVSFYGQDIVIFEPTSLAEYISEIDNDLASIKLLYYITKEAIMENSKNIIDNFKATEPTKWIAKTVNLYAFGKITFVNNNMEDVLLENSAIVKILKNKVKNPPDYILRGLIAGFSSIIRNENLECIETECQATGSQYCKLIIGSQNYLKSKYLSLYETQI